MELHHVVLGQFAPVNALAGLLERIGIVGVFELRPDASDLGILRLRLSWNGPGEDGQRPERDLDGAPHSGSRRPSRSLDSPGTSVTSSRLDLNPDRVIS